ncbi:alanine--tRNA ligase [Actinomyces sp. zg-332]|uniref:alanine--tRNA ligase n=1 Tax=Actinomyces sp. zg-332 TaxID=2708340 RepID=UPI0014230379|nr:alanine--tRNA ligase [Actinomyces sp. zg-332]QPK94607.1 alanine--tRNA ligase [Actinomyces sp. zg-332]
MRTAEIRNRWLDYFKKNGHEICPSVPLISPDPSILFTIAGMVPFIPYIVGTQPAPWPCAASVQKCIRTNDIEEVGKTTRHGTFFQMCGNFSFGDYFKEGAITYAWDLLTGDVNEGKYGLDGDKIWVTIWEQDDEAESLWLNKIGLDPAHLQKLPRDEIFWDTGQPGPAGPCAELHYDRGPSYGPDGGPLVDKAGDRFLEVWNLVFDQYMRGEGTGKDYPLLGELDAKAIDTGLGLERLAFLLQGKDNMYETDEVFPVIGAVEEISGKKYGLDTSCKSIDDVRMRVVADHVRSAMMLINDGVRPGNDGRGYVLRRLIRRAVRSMKLLGVDAATLPDLLPVSMNSMKESYPELETNFETISNVAFAEEEAFRKTLNAGTTILDVAVEKVKKDNQTLLSGEEAFQLHDTYGFPIDLTLEMAAEQGVKVDEKRFRELMTEQKERARADALSKKTGHVDSRVYNEIMQNLAEPVKFLGYTDSTTESKVIAILVDGKPSPVVSAPAEVELVLDQTPFYAEMGGQLADQGYIRFAGGALVEVHDVQAPVKGVPVHRGTLIEGTIALDENAVAEIDTKRRLDIARAHTATHMVHEVIMEHLGKSATQAGSENSPSRMRFDFRNPSALGTSFVNDLEEEVNVRLAENLEVTDEIMDLDEAKALGAQALFGEKYGKRVRVVSIGGDWSRELCGGTHVKRTGDIGRITVLGESSIGSGIRRIEALVGDGAYSFNAKEHALVSQLSSLLGARQDELVSRVDSIMAKLKETEKELDALRQSQLLSQVDSIVEKAVKVNDVICASYNVGKVSNIDDLRTLVMSLRDKLPNSEKTVVAVGGDLNNKAMVVIATNENARKAGIKAGLLVKQAATRLGGGGGGKDDMAQGGGQNIGVLDQALEAVLTDIASI